MSSDSARLRQHLPCPPATTQAFTKISHFSILILDVGLIFDYLSCQILNILLR